MKQRYHINKYIFRTIVLLNVLFLLIIVMHEGGIKNTFGGYTEISCPANSPLKCPHPNCINPYDCTYEPLTQGTSILIGHKPNLKLTNTFNITVWTTLIIGIIINHLLYNKKYKLKKIELN